MYLRFGWVLGNVGLGETLLIVTMASSVTFLTGLALSSLATNMKIKGGGAYYIISRSLGVEIGAAIGLPLFFAQALGISFYIAGFSESIHNVYPDMDPKLIGSVTLCLLTVLAYLSADIALKSQLLVMFAIGLSLISLFAGGGDAVSANTLPPEAVPATRSFWYVFAVFFPAVTGIEAGIAMSGDLKNPGHSLPLGTLSAVVCGYLVYIAIPIFLSFAVADKSLLLTNSLILRDVARWGDLILIGLWGAALSSAMGAILGAPRTLQALASDKIVPPFMGRSFGANKDPHVATIIAFGIGLAGILLGDLNLIAPVLSMFFLTSYGLINLSAALEELIKAPSWRPKFKVPWKVNMLGALGCVSAMTMINAGATIIAVLICSTIYLLMKRRKLMAHWGDVRYGFLMLAAQYSIQLLSRRAVDTKSWKPNILVLSGSPIARWYLIELASAISQNRSLLTVATIIKDEKLAAERSEHLRKAIKDYLIDHNVNAIIKILPSCDIETGLESLIRSYGYGPIVPNTILLGETEKEENFITFSRTIELICRTQRNLIIVRGGELKPDLAAGSRIDIWWGGVGNNAPFMVALALQLKDNKGWEDADLVLNTVVEPGNEEKRSKANAMLSSFITQGRFEARMNIIEAKAHETFDAIREESSKASLVFLGMRGPLEDETIHSYSLYYENLLLSTENLPPTAIVYAAENLNFRDLFLSF